MARISKERDLSPKQRIAVIKEFNLKKGLLVASFCGIMSACFSYGLAAGGPVREAAEVQLLETAERLAEEDGKSRVGVETVIAAWVANTPETIRPDLPRQMERFGLDPSEYEHLL